MSTETTQLLHIAAARLQLDNTETIGGTIGTPGIKFSQSNGTQSVITITLGFSSIANFVADSETPVDDHIKEKFRDAVIDIKEFFQPGNVTVTFTGKGDSVKMTIEATLDTKIPGTGALLPLN